AIIKYTVNTPNDTPDVLGDEKPEDANGNISLRAVIEYANGHPQTGDLNLNAYEVDFNIGGQTITLDPNLSTLVLTSNFNFIGGDVTVERNVAAAAFGLFEVNDNMKVRFSEMTLQGGRTLDHGGAISVGEDAVLKVESCDFINNEAVLSGGAIAGFAATNSLIFITNSTFGLNEAERAGGAIAVNGAGGLTMYGCSILGNEVTGVGMMDGFGGGVSVVTTDTLIEQTSIIGNEGTKDGGGVYVLACELTMNGGQLYGNTAGGYGGGIYVDAEDETVTLNGVRITQNGAGQKGGGAYIFNGTLAGSVSELTGNTATGGIAGIGFKQGQATAPIAVPPNQQTVEQDP
ncbi:MAG: right-handed parallel beta-helix repeat-containing protein, partial [Planctomycetia bacterium]|nr:right-handed parallel beta-helix repeat-containing protein [Planctomycetia bacterium]